MCGNSVITEIQPGDLVDFGQYGRLYVTNIYSTVFWVTDLKEDRYDRNSCGWSLEKSYAEKIVEKGVSNEAAD